MPNIDSITCDKFINSRGGWTICTKVTLDDGSVGRQTVPDGASVGENEAVSLPVEKAIPNVIGSMRMALLGKDALEQEAVDTLLIDLDGTATKKKLGGNSILSVSLAVAKAAAVSQKKELYEYLKDMYGNSKALKFPTPVFNVLNGGKHARNNLSFQEFMIIPAEYMAFDRAVETGVRIYNNLKEVLEKEGMNLGVGDEGGFAPKGLTTLKALKFMQEAAGKEYKLGHDVFLGMDVAAGSFYENGSYSIKEEDITLNGKRLQGYYSHLLKEFELVYLEDPFYEKDTKAWQNFSQMYGDKLMIVADDLVVTNSEILQKAIGAKLANAVIVKPNQIGTLTETLQFIKMAKKAKMAITVSHRSGDTAEDTFIADLAVAIEADFIKAGAPARGERVVKYNRLLEIFYADQRGEST